MTRTPGEDDDGNVIHYPKSATTAKELPSVLRRLASHVFQMLDRGPADEVADALRSAADLLDQQAAQIETLREALMLSDNCLDGVKTERLSNGELATTLMSTSKEVGAANNAADVALSAPSAGWPEWLVRLTREIVILQDGDWVWATEQLPNVPQPLRDVVDGGGP